jgi:hypothetical protein
VKSFGMEEAVWWVVGTRSQLSEQTISYIHENSVVGVDALYPVDGEYLAERSANARWKVSVNAKNQFKLEHLRFK